MKNKRNCVKSRAYHNAKNAALREGKPIAEAKELGRAASAQAGQQCWCRVLCINVHVYRLINTDLHK